MQASRTFVRAAHPPQRCALCHDRLLPKEPTHACSDCSSVTHVECVLPGRRCPSLACATRVQVRLHPRSERSGVALFFGVILPLIALFAVEQGLGEHMLPEYKTDGWYGLLLHPQALRWTYPLLGWAFAAFVAAELGVRRGWVRVGLVGGLVLGVGYACAVAPLIPLSLITLPFAVGLLGLSPFFALAAFGWRLHATRSDEEPRTDVGWVAWSLFGYAATHGMTQEVQRLYAALPESPAPDCYLATVAAEGAQRWVRADPVRFADRVQPVTAQLRIFKAGELFLRWACPPLHRPLRALYDRLGPPLAQLLRGRPRLACAAHVALLPLQALTWAVLWLALPDPRRTIQAVYPAANSTARRLPAAERVSSAAASAPSDRAVS